MSDWLEFMKSCRQENRMFLFSLCRDKNTDFWIIFTKWSVMPNHGTEQR